VRHSALFTHVLGEHSIRNPFGSETVGSMGIIQPIGPPHWDRAGRNDHYKSSSLAQLHVDRCRQLEGIPGNEEKLFSEWTLPPEEAIEKLVEEAKSQQEPEVCLATACPSTRTMIPHAPGSSSLNQPLAERRNKDALLVWCRALGMESAFVKNNMETLRIFLPH
jgi:hypothetical protein